MEDDTTNNNVRYEHIMLCMMSYFPDKSPRDIEDFLEYMSDMGLLSEKGKEIRTAFWQRFWAE